MAGTRAWARGWAGVTGRQAQEGGGADPSRCPPQQSPRDKGVALLALLLICDLPHPNRGTRPCRFWKGWDLADPLL